MPASALNACLFVQNSSATTSQTSWISARPFLRASTAGPSVDNRIISPDERVPEMELGKRTVCLYSDVHLGLRGMGDGVCAKLNIRAVLKAVSLIIRSDCKRAVLTSS